MTAIGYTGPIFSMIGAAYLLGERCASIDGSPR